MSVVISQNYPVVNDWAAMSWIYPTNYPIRDYQLQIVKSALFQNTLVCLPTGMGKTLIASVIMYNYYRWFPNGKVVFMAPTKPLVSQQVSACHSVMGIPENDIAHLEGSVSANKREDLWSSKRVFFCTPHVLVNDLKNGKCNPKLFVCIVFDEAHRATGQFAYNQLMQEICRYSSHFRVLALSATPGATGRAIQSVINNLLISKIEFRAEDDPELLQYSYDKDIEIIKCPPSTATTLADSLKNDLNDLIRVSSADLLRYGLLLSDNPMNVNTFIISEIQRNFEELHSGSFSQDTSTQLQGQISFLLELVSCRKLLTEGNATSSSNNRKQCVSEALLILKSYCIKVRQQEQQRLPTIELVKSVLSGFKFSKLMTVLLKAEREAQDIHRRNPKLVKLRDILISHFMSSVTTTSKDMTKVIVFAQLRATVQEIFQGLSNCHPAIRVSYFVGQNSTAKDDKDDRDRSRIGMSQTEQERILQDFRGGVYNVLVATCIAEEGLDIGLVDLVVSYEASASPIRMVQRMGRTGRQRMGKVIMLVTEGKDEDKLDKSSASVSSIASVLSSGKTRLIMCNASPRMLPEEVEPVLQLQRMEVGELQSDLISGKIRANQSNLTVTTSSSSSDINNNQVVNNQSGIGNASANLNDNSLNSINSTSSKSILRNSLEKYYGDCPVSTASTNSSRSSQVMFEVDTDFCTAINSGNHSNSRSDFATSIHGNNNNEIQQYSKRTYSNNSNGIPMRQDPSNNNSLWNEIPTTATAAAAATTTTDISILLQNSQKRKSTYLSENPKGRTDVLTNGTSPDSPLTAHSHSLIDLCSPAVSRPAANSSRGRGDSLTTTADTDNNIRNLYTNRANALKASFAAPDREESTSVLPSMSNNHGTSPIDNSSSTTYLDARTITANSDVPFSNIKNRNKVDFLTRFSSSSYADLVLALSTDPERATDSSRTASQSDIRNNSSSIGFCGVPDSFVTNSSQYHHGEATEESEAVIRTGSKDFQRGLIKICDNINDISVVVASLSTPRKELDTPPPTGHRKDHHLIPHPPVLRADGTILYDSGNSNSNGNSTCSKRCSTSNSSSDIRHISIDSSSSATSKPSLESTPPEEEEGTITASLPYLAADTRACTANSVVVSDLRQTYRGPASSTSQTCPVTAETRHIATSANIENNHYATSRNNSKAYSTIRYSNSNELLTATSTTTRHPQRLRLTTTTPFHSSASRATSDPSLPSTVSTSSSSSSAHTEHQTNTKTYEHSTVLIRSALQQHGFLLLLSDSDSENDNNCDTMKEDEAATQVNNYGNSSNLTLNENANRCISKCIQRFEGDYSDSKPPRSSAFNPCRNTEETAVTDNQEAASAAANNHRIENRVNAIATRPANSSDAHTENNPSSDSIFLSSQSPIISYNKILISNNKPLCHTPPSSPSFMSLEDLSVSPREESKNPSPPLHLQHNLQGTQNLQHNPTMKMPPPSARKPKMIELSPSCVGINSSKEDVKPLSPIDLSGSPFFRRSPNGHNSTLSIYDKYNTAQGEEEEALSDDAFTSYMRKSKTNNTKNINSNISKSNNITSNISELASDFSEFTNSRRKEQNLKYSETVKQTDGVPSDDEDSLLLDLPCSVCCQPDSYDDNPIIFCDGSCGLCVHQLCYGLEEVPRGDFYCEYCHEMKYSNSSRRDSVKGARCVLCGVPGGLLKRAVSGEWVHSLCVLFLDELSLDDSMRLSNLYDLDKDRGTLTCALCHRGGGGGIGGGVVQCRYDRCLASVHPFCAHTNGWKLAIYQSSSSWNRTKTAMRMEEEEEEEVVLSYHIYCPVHNDSNKKAGLMFETGSSSKTHNTKEDNAVSLDDSWMSTSEVETPLKDTNRKRIRKLNQSKLPTSNRKRARRNKNGSSDYNTSSTPILFNNKMIAANKDKIEKQRQSKLERKMARQYFDFEAAHSGSDTDDCDSGVAFTLDDSQLSAQEDNSFINDGSFTQPDSPMGDVTQMAMYHNLHREFMQSPDALASRRPPLTRIEKQNGILPLLSTLKAKNTTERNNKKIDSNNTNNNNFSLPKSNNSKNKLHSKDFTNSNNNFSFEEDELFEDNLIQPPPPPQVNMHRDQIQTPAPTTTTTTAASSSSTRKSGFGNTTPEDTSLPISSLKSISSSSNGSSNSGSGKSDAGSISGTASTGKTSAKKRPISYPTDLSNSLNTTTTTSSNNYNNVNSSNVWQPALSNNIIKQSSKPIPSMQPARISHITTENTHPNIITRLSTNSSINTPKDFVSSKDIPVKRVPKRPCNDNNKNNTASLATTMTTNDDNISTSTIASYSGKVMKPKLILQNAVMYCSQPSRDEEPVPSLPAGQPESLPNNAEDDDGESGEDCVPDFRKSKFSSAKDIRNKLSNISNNESTSFIYFNSDDETDW